MHRLQIRSNVHNYGAPPTIPPSYIRVRVVLMACDRGSDHYLPADVNFNSISTFKRSINSVEFSRILRRHFS